MNLVALRRQAWPITCVALLLLFSVPRFSHLTARPLHHDEGVNGIFLKNLIQDNNWSYDPKNYHGPTLYFFQVIPTWIATFLEDGPAGFKFRSVTGITPFALRFTMALAGVVLLALLLGSWRVLGRWGAAGACIFAGLSCDLIFFSRYFIHEIYVVLFTFATVVAALRFHQTKRPRYAYAAALCATILFCTKETAVFHLVIVALAYACARITHRFFAGENDAHSEQMETRPASDASPKNRRALHSAIIAILCAAVWLTLFTSFFKNWNGPLDSFRTFFYWGAEGMESGHEKPFFYYFTDIVVRYETVTLMFGLVGIVVAFARNERKGLFFAFWALGMAAFYSLVPYKTPWLVVNIVFPMAVVAGYGVQRLYEWSMGFDIFYRRRVMAVASLLTIFVTAAEARQTFRVNFVEYDNDRHPQIYAHTIRDVNDMISRIDAIGARLGRGIMINVFSDTYWPLPLYLIQYPDVRFWGDKVEDAGATADAPILIVQPKLQSKVQPRLQSQYAIRNYNLRGGVPLSLYINRTVTGDTTSDRPLDLTATRRGPSDPRPGLMLESYKDGSFTGPADQTLLGDTSYNFSWLSDGEKKFTSPFSLRWTGFIHIKKEGLYRFALESDDGSWLSIDNTLVIDNGGDHAVVKLWRDVRLSAGYHKIELKYYDALGGAVLRFTWIPPEGSEAIVPADVMFAPG